MVRWRRLQRRCARVRAGVAATGMRSRPTRSPRISAYARRVGLRLREPDPADRLAVAAARAAVLDVLRRPSDGSPLPGGRWPLRYAARRIAWHALDHAWEIEDRSAPA